MIRQIQKLFEQNPIIQHTIHHPAKYTMRQLLWGIVPVSWSLAALGTVAILEGYYSLVSFLWFVTWGVMVFSPVVIAGATAQWMVTEIQTGQFELLYLTTMADDKFIWGYVISMLYRMRLLIAVMVAIMPLLVISTFYILIRLNVVVTNISPFIQATPPSRLEILLPTSVFMILTIGMWGASGLGAAAGVSYALRYRQRSMAIMVSIISTTVAMLLLTSAVWFALLLPQAAQVSITICSPVIFVVFFVLIWDYMLRRARLSVRMPSEE
ncbi:MAG: hypothetical protein L0154_22215 [Chloroflexi bacterium]|nr:hypothetical protein [Chloroflexota bacterium]